MLNLTSQAVARAANGPKARFKGGVYSWRLSTMIGRLARGTQGIGRETDEEKNQAKMLRKMFAPQQQQQQHQ